jgi:hypothetical protein
MAQTRHFVCQASAPAAPAAAVAVTNDQQRVFAAGVGETRSAAPRTLQHESTKVDGSVRRSHDVGAELTLLPARAEPNNFTTALRTKGLL